MKKYISYIAFCLLVTFVACTKSDSIDNEVVGENKITITTSMGRSVQMRAAVEDTDSESRVEWIDLFIFDAAENKVHSERIDRTANPDIGGGSLSISRARNTFAANATYWVFLVANCKADLQNEAIDNLDDLKHHVQEDENLHLSGFRAADGSIINEDAPALFLMDGVAYSGNTEPQEARAVVLNNGNASENTNLNATLYRAAAKIVINIKQGKNVELHNYLEAKDGSGTVTDVGTAEYTFYQLPITTSLLASATRVVNPTVQSTSEEHSNNYSFIFTQDATHTEALPNHNIQLVGYSYAYSWNSAEDATNLVVNIPIRWNEAASTDYTTHEGWSIRTHNWYRLPMTKERKFERNKLYEVNVTIDAIGATSKSSAIVLENIEFNTYNWVAQNINIGESGNDPEYLMLNRDTVHIYNTNIDTDQLTFSSSSFIPATGVKIKDVEVDGTTLKAIYYYNKFGQKTYLETINEDAANSVNAVAEQNVLNGGITINSPIIPATQEQIDQAIATLTKPELPDVQMPLEPVEPDGKPQKPLEVIDPGARPAEPNPADYVKETEITSESVTTGGKNNRTETQTQTQTEYQYITNADGSATFYKRTRTRERTRTYSKNSGWSDWNRDFETDPDSWWEDWSAWTSDSAPQYEYDAALNEYNEWPELKDAYDEYVVDLQQYNTDLESWKSSTKYQEYLNELSVYESELATYNAAMQSYQDALAIYEQEKQNIIDGFGDNEPSHYNTIRYIEFVVENEHGLTEEFLVMQYPVIYITNTQGFFSYRSDFVSEAGAEPTHFQNRVANYLTAAYWGSTYIQVYDNGTWTKVDGSDSYSAVQTDRNGNYYADGKELTSSNSNYYYEYTEEGVSYRKRFNSISEVFTSDVVRSVYTTGDNIGKSNLDSYRINGTQNGWSYSDSKDPGNQRMYHVHVTATSGDYTVGRPRIVDAQGNLTTDVENGQTDDSADNALLVSPSFMIASQLGVTSSISAISDSAYARAIDQCKNYVETYYDDLNNNNTWDEGEPVHHYKDWRLPTAEEIRIIATLQGQENGAVDVVLAGANYFCASPSKSVKGAGNTNGYFIRCIRDAY